MMRWPTTRTGTCFAAVAAAVALGSTACAGPSTQVAAPPPPNPEPPRSKSAPRQIKTDPLTRPDSPGRIVYSSELVSEPMPKQAKAARVSKAKALGAADVGQFGPGLQPGTPTATLRMVSLRTPGAAAQAARPSWVLTWAASRPDIKGPATNTAADRRRLAADVQCIFVMVVDADTGVARDARQLCVPKP
jgi:hypothetical protein